MHEGTNDDKPDREPDRPDLTHAVEGAGDDQAYGSTTDRPTQPDAVQTRMAELRSEGHGPQRHCEISDDDMKARLSWRNADGTKVPGIDPDTKTASRRCGMDAT